MKPTDWTQVSERVIAELIAMDKRIKKQVPDVRVDPNTVPIINEVQLREWIR